MLLPSLRLCKQYLTQIGRRHGRCNGHHRIARRGRPARHPPDDVAIAALEASMATIRPEIRKGRFGPEVAVADDADPTDRLVAFLGRTP